MRIEPAGTSNASPMIARQRQRGSRTHIESRICSRDNATHGRLAVGDGGTRLEHKLIDVLTGMAVGEGWVGAGLNKALEARVCGTP